jgi:hypothetical protein
LTNNGGKPGDKLGQSEDAVWVKRFLHGPSHFARRLNCVFEVVPKLKLKAQNAEVVLKPMLCGSFWELAETKRYECVQRYSICVIVQDQVLFHWNANQRKNNIIQGRGVLRSNLLKLFYVKSFADRVALNSG